MSQFETPERRDLHGDDDHFFGPLDGQIYQRGFNAGREAGYRACEEETRNAKLRYEDGWQDGYSDAAAVLKSNQFSYRIRLFFRHLFDRFITF